MRTRTFARGNYGFSSLRENALLARLINSWYFPSLAVLSMCGLSAKLPMKEFYANIVLGSDDDFEDTFDENDGCEGNRA